MVQRFKREEKNTQKLTEETWDNSCHPEIGEDFLTCT